MHCLLIAGVINRISCSEDDKLTRVLNHSVVQQGPVEPTSDSISTAQFGTVHYFTI